MLHLGAYSCQVGDLLRARNQFERSLHNFTRMRDRRGEAAALRAMANLSIHSGQYEDAHKYASLALSKLGENEDRPRAELLLDLGRAQRGLKRREEAVSNIRQAQGLFQAAGQAGRALECQIELAGVLLDRGDAQRAVAEISDVLPSLRSGAAASMEEPLEAYWTCYLVLRAANDGRAVRVLEVAYQILQERAGHILDQKLRRAFLENVPIHKSIDLEWSNLKTG